jgi:boron transporter
MFFMWQVSSLIAQGTEFLLRKPSGFRWDLFLLGITTGVAGLLGILAPNGLTPQAHFHKESLCGSKVVPDLDEDGANKGHVVTKVDHVVEQRASNLAQGLFTLGTTKGLFPNRPSPHSTRCFSRSVLRNGRTGT